MKRHVVVVLAAIPVLAVSAAAQIQALEIAPPIPVLPTVTASPVRLAADEAGHLFVTDYDAGLVYILNPGSLAARKIAVDGSVTGVATHGGRVFVGNETHGRIEVYDLGGALLGILGGPGVSIADPTDLAVDAERRLLFAVDGGAKTIRVFSLTGPGALIGAISGPGLAEHLLQHPTGLTVDTAAEEVLIADYGDIEHNVPPRVLIFGYDGAYHGSVSGNGGSRGYYFSKPQGIVVGDSGHLFVVDAWLGRVVVMDRATGAQVTTIGDFGIEPGRLRRPLDLLILGDGRDLYVTGSQIRPIEVFPGGGLR